MPYALLLEVVVIHLGETQHPVLHAHFMLDHELRQAGAIDENDALDGGGELVGLTREAGGRDEHTLIGALPSERTVVLCLSLWQAWRHLLGADVAYGQIFIRDRFRCTSPVCNRQDVTPHHLQFRSAGGSDENDNVAAVCTWCHLCGVHGGRIRAVGSAELIRWELGAPGRPCLVVHGRERMAA